MSELTAPAEFMTVTLEHRGPVELAVLTDSLMALASSHARFAARSGATINDDAVKLYVKEIRSGSIIVELIALTGQLFPMLGGVNTLVIFGRNIAALIGFLRGALDEPPTGTIAADFQEVARLVEPVAQDPKATMSILAGAGSVVIVNQVINSENANAIQNRARNRAAQLAAPVNGRFEKQVFFWYQARDNSKSKAGDQGIIEPIFPGPVKTIFATPELKAEMLADTLFAKYYIVDVDVQSVEGRARLYNIVAIHGSFDREM